MKRVPQSATARRTGQTTVTTSAAPVTQIDLDSSSNTTFTTTTAVDQTSWDLSQVIAGDIVITSDNCIGIITDVNVGFGGAPTTVTVGQGWSCEVTGFRRNPVVTASVPAAGSTMEIHRISHAKTLRLKADPDNTDEVFIGKHGDATISDFVLEAGEHVDLVPEEPGNYVDVTQVYAIAASGTQTIDYIPGVER